MGSRCEHNAGDKGEAKGTAAEELARPCRLLRRVLENLDKYPRAEGWAGGVAEPRGKWGIFCTLFALERLKMEKGSCKDGGDMCKEACAVVCLFFSFLFWWCRRGERLSKGDWKKKKKRQVENKKARTLKKSMEIRSFRSRRGTVGLEIFLVGVSWRGCWFIWEAGGVGSGVPSSPSPWKLFWYRDESLDESWS